MLHLKSKDWNISDRLNFYISILDFSFNKLFYDINYLIYSYKASSEF